MTKGKKIGLSQGVVLIAEPFMKDSYFKRSVVLLAEHNEKGTLGFMLNKAIELKINDAVVDFPDFNENLFLGGPVAMDQLFYVHRYGDLIEDSIEIKKGLWWGGNFNTVKELIQKQAIDLANIRFFVGYAGWEVMQLEKELKEKSWIITEQPADFVFDKDYLNHWQNALKTMGGEYTMMASFPEDPSLN